MVERDKNRERLRQRETKAERDKDLPVILMSLHEFSGQLPAAATGIETSRRWRRGRRRRGRRRRRRESALGGDDRC